MPVLGQHLPVSYANTDVHVAIELQRSLQPFFLKKKRKGEVEKKNVRKN